MSLSLTVCKTNSSTVNENLQRWTSIAGHLAMGTTESALEVPIRDAGSFVGMSVNVSANSLPSGTTPAGTTVTLRKSQTSTACVVTFAAGQIGIITDTTSVSYANTDEASIQVDTPNNATGGTQSITFKGIATAYQPTAGGDCITFMAARGVASTSTDSTTFYCLPNGFLDGWNTSETERKLRMLIACTACDFCVNVTANARAGSSTVFRTRKNGANGSQTKTFAATQIGVLEDTSGTDSLAVGDDYNYSMTTGVTGSTGNNENISVAMISTTLVNTVGQFIQVASQNSGAVSFAAGSTTWLAAAGRLFAETNANEDNAEVTGPFKFNVDGMNMYVTAFSLDGAATEFRVRDNGVDGNLATTIINGSGLPGLKVNSTHSADVIASGDTFAVKADMADSTSGTISIQWISMACNCINAVACAMTGSGTLAGTAKGAGALLSGMTASGTLAGTSAGAGALLAALQGNGSLAGTPQGAGALLASLTASGVLGALIRGDVAILAALSASGVLGGSLGGQGALLAALAASGTLGGSLAGSGSLAANLAASGALNGILLGNGALLANLSAQGSLAALLSSESFIFANLSASGVLAAALQGNAQLVANLAGSGVLGGALVGKGALAANLTAQAVLAGLLQSQSSLICAMTGTGSLSGLMLGSAALAAALQANGSLGANISAQALLQAALQGNTQLQGLLLGKGALAAALQGNGSLSGTGKLAGALLASLTAQGSMSATGSANALIVCAMSATGTLVLLVAESGISLRTIRQVLRERLFTTAGVTPVIFAHENRPFRMPNPPNTHIRERLRIIEETKVAAELLAIRGSVVYEIAVPRDTGTERAGALAKKIAEKFQPVAKIHSQGVEVQVYRASRESFRQLDEAYSGVPVRMLWIAYGKTALP